jgi:hypothetical protein
VKIVVRLALVFSGLFALAAFFTSLTRVWSLNIRSLDEQETLNYHFSLYLPDNRNSFFTGIIEGAERAASELNAAISVHSIDPAKNEFEMASYTGVDGELSEESWQRYREELSLSSDKGFTILVEYEANEEENCAVLARELSFKHHCIYDVMLNRGLFLVSECIERDLFLRRWKTLVSGLFPENAVWYWGIGGLYRGPELYLPAPKLLWNWKPGAVQPVPMSGNGSG